MHQCIPECAHPGGPSGPPSPPRQRRKKNPPDINKYVEGANSRLWDAAAKWEEVLPWTEHISPVALKAALEAIDALAKIGEQLSQMNHAREDHHE